MFEYKMDHIMPYNATLTALEVIGEVPQGIRVNFYVIGGNIAGPKVVGKLRPVGADWLTLRQDDIGVLDVKATAETNDGALLNIVYSGIIDLGPAGYRDFLDDKPLASGTAIRINPKVSTSHPNYLWLNRLHCVGLGGDFLERSEVAYDVYAVL
jgi:hypothetical protein